MLRFVAVPSMVMYDKFCLCVFTPFMYNTKNFEVFSNGAIYNGVITVNFSKDPRLRSFEFSDFFVFKRTNLYIVCLFTIVLKKDPFAVAI